MPRVDDQGNIIPDAKNEIEIINPSKKKSSMTKVLILSVFDDDTDVLEKQLEKFINTPPKKKVRHFGFSSLGIKHFAILIYEVDQ